MIIINEIRVNKAQYMMMIHADSCDDSAIF